MANEILMSIPGMTGETTLLRHAGKIDLLACDWVLNRLIDPATGQLVSPVLSRLTGITKRLDRTSPLLAQAAALGTTLASCEIIGLGTDPVLGREGISWRVQMTNCRVEDYSQSVNTGGESVVESFRFSYSVMQVDSGFKLDGTNRYTFRF